MFRHERRNRSNIYRVSKGRVHQASDVSFYQEIYYPHCLNIEYVILIIEMCNIRKMEQM